MVMKLRASLLAAGLALAACALPHAADSAEFVLRFATLNQEETN
jgi:hypothetical protein